MALSDVEKQGEDTVSQLWRSPLDHLEYVVVEGFKVDGFSDEEVQVSVDKSSTTSTPGSAATPTTSSASPG